MAIDLGMTSTKLVKAKLHVYNVCSQGNTITLIKPAAKDEMGTALTESSISLKTHPIRFSPFDREVSQKISWSEDVDILCYVSKLEIDKLSININKLKKQYGALRYNNKTYTIRYIENYSSFGADFLYVVIGGKI